MSIFGKRTAVTTINDRKYKLRRWNVATTNREGIELIKVLAPSVAVVADSWLSNSNRSEIEELLGQEDISYTLTSAATHLSTMLEPDHVSDLYDKLLSGLSIYDKEKEDWVEIHDWNEFFDDDVYEEDFMNILTWSVKENLYNFFTKQAMFQSTLKSLKTKILEVFPSAKEKLS